MKKNPSKKSISLANLHLPAQKISIANKKYFRELQTTIPSLQEAIQRDQYMQKLHKWRKGSKFFKLQQTYDENCRIFVSLRNQKSQYKLPKINKNVKLPYIKLAPLTERKLNTQQPTTNTHRGQQQNHKEGGNQLLK